MVFLLYYILNEFDCVCMVRFHEEIFNWGFRKYNAVNNSIPHYNKMQKFPFFLSADFMYHAFKL